MIPAAAAAAAAAAALAGRYYVTESRYRVSAQSDLSRDGHSGWQGPARARGLPASDCASDHMIGLGPLPGGSDTIGAPPPPRPGCDGDRRLPLTPTVTRPGPQCRHRPGVGLGYCG
jgi:hypothetical protein